MAGRDEMLSILREALKSSSADQTELVLAGEDLNYLQVAENQIQNNLSTSDCDIVARVVIGKKVGIASTNAMSVDGIKRALADAVEICSFQEDDPEFPGVPLSVKAADTKAYFDSTANLSASERANVIWQINKIAEKDKLQTAGSFKTTVNRVAVVNSLGTEQYFEGTLAEYSITVSGESGSSGYAIACDRDVAAMNVGALGETAVSKAVQSQDPTTIPSGQYTVILEPAAVGQLLLFLSFMGFGSKTLIQQRSFMAGKIGQQITGSNITITEDPYHPRMLGMPFDFEGVPRKKVELIAGGIAMGVVSNSYDARQLQAESTGHAHIATNTFTPYPKYMVMDGGDKPISEIVRSTANGIYITHFWYVNYINPMKTMVTGTTRDGTFLVENGKITKPIVNMRMQQSILDAFSNCDALSSERVLYPQYSVLMLVPAARINNFQLNEENS